jgi:hypothetical protein
VAGIDRIVTEAAAVSNIQAMERMRSYLWTVLQDGSLRDNPSLVTTVLTALQSTNIEWIPAVFNLVRIQPLRVPDGDMAQKKEPLFREPAQQDLAGSILTSYSIPSRFPVPLPLESFGQKGHIGIFGTTGPGKSTLLNFTTYQLVSMGIRTFVYDGLDQPAPLLVPLLPADQLSVIDYRDYRRNFLTGPPSCTQMDWIRQASVHLMESLAISPVTMNYLIQVCEAIISQGRIATIPLVIEYAQRDRSNSQSSRALLNRLLPLTMAGDWTFTCDKGFNLDKVLNMSCIFNLKDASPMARKLIANDHYFFLMKTRKALTKWRLDTVLVFHEAGSQLSGSDTFFMTTLREARNLGIGMLFADQAPHLESPLAKSAIGAKGLFRLEDPASLEGFRVGMDLSLEQRSAVLNLPDRVMLLRRPDIPHPFLVKVPVLF